MMEIKERPILFSTPMVIAIDDGSKTQTRRIVKSCKDKSFSCPLMPHELAGEVNAGNYTNSPYGGPGDRLWVRETWQHSNWPHGPYDERCHIYYRADYADDPHGFDGEKSLEGKYRTWKPSIHMFRRDSRILLEITGVRVERLQDISEDDAVAEGSEPWAGKRTPWVGVLAPVLIHGFATLWEEVNGSGSWDLNPWVWCITFKRIVDEARKSEKVE